MVRHGDALLVFDGFTGAADTPAHVHEFAIATATWRHVCLSTPVARSVALQVGRLVVFVGGHKTTTPVRRLGTSVCFDAVAKQWVGKQRADVHVASAAAPAAAPGRNNSAAAFTPRSAHCGMLIVGDTLDAVRSIFDGGDARDDDDDDNARSSWKAPGAARCVLIGGSEERPADARLPPIPFETLFPEAAVPQQHEAPATQTLTTATATAASLAALPPASHGANNGGSAIGNVAFIDLVLPSSSLLGACTAFLARSEHDDLLDDLF